jgi:hypothetical protein
MPRGPIRPDRPCPRFRQRAFESLGPRADALLARAEKGVRFLAPEFDSARLGEGTAILVLDLVDQGIAAAPFWRRAALRKSAETLLADFYAKQYDLLERRDVLGAVEQAYYRLKR